MPVHSLQDLPIFEHMLLFKVVSGKHWGKSFTNINKYKKMQHNLYLFIYLFIHSFF